MDSTSFIVIGAERTGSNLLTGLIDSHPRASCFGELFNPRLIREESVPASLLREHDEADLVALRRDDPVEFLQVVHHVGVTAGFQAIGFKLLYFHGTSNEEVLSYLAAEKRIKVIHLKRRNKLRRLLSHEQASKIDEWAIEAGKKAGTPRPPVRINLRKLFSDFQYLQEQIDQYEELFRDHDTLQLTYEELAVEPEAVGHRALEFLGVEDATPLEVRYEKTGTKSLRNAIVNYDELKTTLTEWLSFFED